MKQRWPKLLSCNVVQTQEASSSSGRRLDLARSNLAAWVGSLPHRYLVSLLLIFEPVRSNGRFLLARQARVAHVRILIAVMSRAFSCGLCRLSLVTLGVRRRRGAVRCGTGTFGARYNCACKFSWHPRPPSSSSTDTHSVLPLFALTLFCVFLSGSSCCVD